jgi:hypothetical protein
LCTNNNQLENIRGKGALIKPLPYTRNTENSNISLKILKHFGKTVGKAYLVFG